MGTYVQLDGNTRLHGNDLLCSTGCLFECLSVLNKFDARFTAGAGNLEQDALAKVGELEPVLCISAGGRDISIVYKCPCPGRVECHAYQRVIVRIMIFPGRYESRSGCRGNTGRRPRSDYQPGFGDNGQILRSLRPDKCGIYPTSAFRSCRKLDLQPRAIRIFACEADHILRIQRSQGIKTRPGTAPHVNLLLNDSHAGRVRSCLLSANDWHLWCTRHSHILGRYPAFSIHCIRVRIIDLPPVSARVFACDLDSRICRNDPQHGAGC